MTRAAAGSLPERRPYVSLRGRAEFSRIYRNGTRRRVGEIVVISTPGRAGPTRVGIVAGRRIGGAVVRNRAKRRLREALARAEVPAEGSYIVVALSDLAKVGFAELVAWVRKGAAPAGEKMEQEE